MIFIWLIVLAVCLIVLVKSADIFVKYSEKVGLAMGLSSFVIGATIVAVGTSLPELVSSLFAVLDGKVTEFVADNAIGSNIANIMLILGIGAIYAKSLKVKTSLIDIDLPFFFASMAMFVYFAWDKQITTWEGLLLLIFFIIFTIYSAKASADPKAKKEDREEMAELKEQYNGVKKKKTYAKFIIYILISIVAIALSAKYLITSILTLSDLLGISSSILTITVVALGTSLPELITAIAAIRLGNHAIAIGNVFGSNTFNLTLVIGVPALFTKLNVDPSTFTIALPFLVLATVMGIIVTLDNKVRIWEGVAMVFMYGVFLLKIIHII